MAGDADLHRELIALRRGRGVLAPDLPARLGPLMRGHTHVERGEPAGPVRARLVPWLESGCRQLPPDLADGVRAGLATHPAARHRFLHERLAWYAEQLGRETRTARRRMDEGFRALAELLSEPDRRTIPVPQSVDVTAEEWWVESLRSVVRLDLPQPMVSEERVIVADVDGISELEVAISLGIPTEPPADPAELGVELVHGGRLALREHPSPSFYRAVLLLPRPLARGERHGFALSITIPGGRLPAPHYALTPFRRYGTFDLVVRFDPAAVPAPLWRVDGLPPRMLDDPPGAGDLVRPDQFGEVSLRFARLPLGRSYGVRWRQ